MGTAAAVGQVRLVDGVDVVAVRHTGRDEQHRRLGVGGRGELGFDRYLRGLGGQAAAEAFAEVAEVRKLGG